MAEIVLVHGIAQEKKSAEKLEKAWLPSLADGVAAAGFPAMSLRIWSKERGRGDIDARMAFYGGLYLVPGKQGGDPAQLSDDDAAFAEQLAEEWLVHVIDRGSSVEQQGTAKRELNILRDEVGVAQGRGEVA